MVRDGVQVVRDGAELVRVETVEGGFWMQMHIRGRFDGNQKRQHVVH